MKLDRETLKRLELLNQIKLTDDQRDHVLSFFAEADQDFSILLDIDTSETDPMVHVIPTTVTLREDDVTQSFSREELQSGAHKTDRGYWCVPKVLE